MTSLLTLALLMSPAVATQPKKAKEPKLIEEDGKKVLVFTIGESDTITLGDLRYKFIPVRVGNSATGIHVDVTNGGKKSIENTKAAIQSKGMVVVDDTGREFRHNSGGFSAGKFVDPGKTFGSSQQFKPEPDPKAKSVTVTFPAPGGDAELWRVVYPRATWVVEK